MAGASPAMTRREWKGSAPEAAADHFFQDLPADALVGERSIVPPPAIALHLFGRGYEPLFDLGEIGIRVVQTENESAAADPAQRETFSAQIILEHPVVTGRLGILHHPDRRQIGDAQGKACACKRLVQLFRAPVPGLVNSVIN